MSHDIYLDSNSSSNVSTTLLPAGNATTPTPFVPRHDVTGWPAPRIFTCAVTTLYGILAVITFFFFVRKLSQTCKVMAEREARLLEDADHSVNSDPRASDAVVHHIRRGGGAAGVDGRSREPTLGMQSEEFRIRSEREDKRKRQQQQQAAAAGGGGGNHKPFAGVRNSVVDDSSDSGILPSSGGGPASVSDVVVEVRSHGTSNSSLMDPSGIERPTYSSRHHVQGCCTRCIAAICSPIKSCFFHACCLPSSYFAERNRSSLMLLGSMFAYATSRCAEMAINVADFDDNQKHGKTGASTLYQTIVTSVPAMFFLLLQMSFNLKWVVNVRNISASGAGPEDSRLSLGPTRSALDYQTRRRGINNNNNNAADDDADAGGPCSCDIGTAALVIGMFFVFIFPIFCALGLLAYLRRHGDVSGLSQSDEFLGLDNVTWMRVITGVAAIPYLMNGFSTIFLGVVLRSVWKPFSDVAITASLHMFVVAILWGVLCTIRGILLLSYDFNAFDKDTKNPWAGPGTLLGEGIMIYFVLFVFYLSSRNQDQVVAAEREAKRSRSRLERQGRYDSGGVGGGLAGGGGAGGGSSGGENKSTGFKSTEASSTSQSGMRLGGGDRLAHNQQRSSDALGLPVYSTWSSHSQTPSRAVSENFAGSDQPTQSRLFYGDEH